MTTALKLPKVGLHPKSGQAKIQVNGRTIYLGPFGSAKARRRYKEECDKLRLRAALGTGDTRIGEAVAEYLERCDGRYVKNGLPTSEVSCVKTALKRFLCDEQKGFADATIADFSPEQLERVRDQMIKAKIVRRSVSKNLGRIIRFFSWCSLRRYCGPEVPALLREWMKHEAPRVGRAFGAVENAPVQPVPMSDVWSTLRARWPVVRWGGRKAKERKPDGKTVLQRLPAVVRGLVHFQRLTGARPGEAISLRPCDVDTAGIAAQVSDGSGVAHTVNVWLYRPETHKTQHHGKERVILIGPRAQRLLKMFMNGLHPTDYVFGSSRRPGQPFGRDAYGRAIDRACLAGGIGEWNPHRLRHSFATNARRADRGQLNTTRILLGHCDRGITADYAARDLADAAMLIARIG